MPNLSMENSHWWVHDQLTLPPCFSIMAHSLALASCNDLLQVSIRVLSTKVTTSWDVKQIGVIVLEGHTGQRETLVQADKNVFSNPTKVHLGQD